MQPMKNIMHKAHHQKSGQANDERRQDKDVAPRNAVILWDSPSLIIDLDPI
jgi:hypothetical protein